MNEDNNDKLHEEFLEDFKQLLKKYKAEFSIDFQADGWSHKEVPVVNFGHIEDIRHYSCLELPSFIDSED